MLAAYTTLAQLPYDAAPGLVTRSIVESIAVRTAQVLTELGEKADSDDVILFGGAARISLLVRRLEQLTGVPVRVGSAEAAASATPSSRVWRSMRSGRWPKDRLGSRSAPKESHTCNDRYPNRATSPIC